jgi:hypothetical protein
LRLLLSILRNQLNELFKVGHIHEDLAHFEAPEGVIEVLWLERALIFDNRFAEVRDL